MDKNIKNNSHVDWFRQSAPYIHAHRGRTLVILFGGEAVEDSSFAHLIHDIALLGSEDQLREQLQHLCAIGVTDFNAAIIPSADGSIDATLDFLQSELA